MALLARRTLPVLAILMTAIVSGAQPADGPIDFNRDIRPILSNNCFKCHKETAHVIPDCSAASRLSKTRNPNHT